MGLERFYETNLDGFEFSNNKGKQRLLARAARLWVAARLGIGSKRCRLTDTSQLLLPAAAKRAIQLHHRLKLQGTDLRQAQLLRE